MLDDGQTVTHKFFEPGADREPCDRACDRAGIGLEAKQARPDLIVQLQRGAFSLIVLRRDQAWLSASFAALAASSACASALKRSVMAASSCAFGVGRRTRELRRSRSSRPQGN